jgi:hypothetical protein
MVTVHEKRLDRRGTIVATMIDPRTLQQKPCPLCDSTSVRWRRPRATDHVLTWLRHIADMTIGGAGSPGRFGRNRRSLGEVRTEVLRSRAEIRTGMKTPEAFWSCSECKHKGYVLNGRSMHT